MKTQIDALHKFQNQLLSTFNAQDLTYFKRSGWNGMLENIDRLYATMLHDWDVLQKDTDSIEKAVRSLDWSLSPYVKKGEKVSAQAQQVAQVVEDALWRRSPQKLGTYAHSFIQLLGAIVHAEFRGQNVHRIVWQNDGKLIYPAAFVQLPPQFLRWEVEPGKPDLLLHVPDGETATPVPFKPYQFIVALNNAGPDHPLYNATYYGLVAWFSAAKNGLGWFMQYAEQHHLPKPVFHYDNDEDREQLIRDLQQDRVINAFLLYGDRQVEWASAPTGTTMPQKELLELAEAHCHKAMLGQTLTSDTSKSGGSLAQAKVHAGIQADEVMKHAEFVADVINRQLIPAIVHLNFGKVEGMPLPELRFKLPQAAANIERAQFWSQVMAIPGMSVVKSEVYDSLGIAMPSDDDEVLETPSQQDAGLAGMLQGFGQEPPAGSDEVALAARSRSKQDLLPAAMQAWLAPIKKKLIEARKAGASFEELREQMLKWRPDTDALAGAFAENVEAGLRGEVEEEVEAAKNKREHPGCNRWRHKPKCPLQTQTAQHDTWQTKGLPSVEVMAASPSKGVTYEEDICKLLKIEKVPGSGREKPVYIDKADGYTVTAPNGRRLKFDASIINHARRDHSKAVWNRRKSHFMDAINAVENPDEIWEQPWGAFAYLKVIKRNEQKRCIVVIENQENIGKAFTFYCSEELGRFNEDRKGKLVYTKTDS